MREVIVVILVSLMISACIIMFLESTDQTTINEQMWLDQQIPKETRQALIDRIKD